MELPYDLLRDILLYANASDMTSLCSMNQFTITICNDDNFWMDKIIYRGYDKFVNAIEPHDKYIFQKYYYNKDKFFHLDSIMKKVQQLYKSIDNANFVQLIINLFNADAFILYKLNLKYIPAAEKLFITLSRNKGTIRLRANNKTVDITQNELDEVLFYIYARKHGIDIYKF